MKTKAQIEKELYTPLVMKSKTISHIILEGTDGVGKTTLLGNLLKAYKYEYVVYDRGELSNFVYAKKYGRPFISLQRNLPFIYVLLIADEPVLRQRILDRAYAENWNYNRTMEELDKIKDQDEFIKAADQMKDDFHIILVDTSKLTPDEVCREVVSRINMYVNRLACDETETNWNKMYRKAAKKHHMAFEVRNNQPYLNGKMFMSESTWQNGAYETFTDKSCPDNLLFATAYSTDAYCKASTEKTIDFAYVINSKINRRPRVIDYYLEFAKHDKTCLVSEKVAKALDHPNFIDMPKVFGDAFLQELGKAKATVYCAPDLEYLKLQTCRLYEGIMARQIVFVDTESDKDCDMLIQIFGDQKIIDLLYVTPDTICANYDKILADEALYKKIIQTQMRWFKNLKNEVFKHV